MRPVVVNPPVASRPVWRQLARVVGMGFAVLLCVGGVGMAQGVEMAEILTYEIYVGATAQQVWDAITTAEWTTRYGYQGRVEYALEPGGAFRAFATPGMIAMGMPEVAIDGEVLEAEPPGRLVQTYRFLFNEATKAEGFTRLTWEIEENGAGFTRLRLTHGVDGAPILAGMVSSPFSEMGTGGWSWILSDLKSVLETGKPLGRR